MIDVGAHHGSAFRPFHDAGWTIHAFEPDPRHFAVPQAHASPMTRSCCSIPRRVERVGRAGPVLRLGGEHWNQWALGVPRLTRGDRNTSRRWPFETSSDLDRVDVLKIDTEGYERFVLEGFPWERIDPSVIVAEFEDAKTARSDTDHRRSRR